MNKFRQRCNHILEDNRNGATFIVERLIDLFSDMARDLPYLDAGSKIRQYAREALAAHPSMAQVINLCRDLLETEGQAEALGASLDRWRVSLRLQNKQTVGYGRSTLAGYPRIFTLSASRLVHDSLTELGEDTEVFISESRPVNEGLKIVNSLRVAVTLTVDAALPGLLREGDCVIIGCDCLTIAGVVNKIGSYPLALAAKEVGVPVYVLCPTSKILRPDRARFYRIVDHPVEELGHDVPKKVTIRNRYFETVPQNLIQAVITEHGVMSVSQIFSGVMDMFSGFGGEAAG